MQEIERVLSSMALFADLAQHRLQAVAHTFAEEWFAAGQRVLRQGLSGSSLYVIIEGEAAVYIDGSERSKLAKGDFFGEISALLHEPPTADVIALSPLRCLVLSAAEVEEFLKQNPDVAFRMLQAEARRLKDANSWRS